MIILNYIDNNINLQEIQTFLLVFLYDKDDFFYLKQINEYSFLHFVFNRMKTNTHTCQTYPSKKTNLYPYLNFLIYFGIIKPSYVDGEYLDVFMELSILCVY